MAEIDLTQAGRRTAQRRITNNRDGVLPGRRITEAPNVAIRGDLRAASRGDGGVDELRRILNDFTGATQNADRAYVEGSMDRRRAEAAQGSLDAQAGGEVASGASGAYTEAFYRERAEARFNEFAPTIKAQVADLVNQGLGPDEIEQALMGSIATFRDDVLDTIPTSLGRMETARRLSALGGELEAGLAEAIQTRTRTEFVTTAQTNLTARIRAGEEVNFEGFITGLREGGVSPADAKRAGMEAVFALALDRDDPQPELLEDLLASTQADGRTPSLSAAEQLQVQDRISQANAIRAQVERERKEEEVETLWAGWVPRLLNGEYVDEDIRARMADGTIDGPTGLQLLNTTASLRDTVEEGRVDEDYVLDLQVRMMTDEINPSRAQITAWYREGRFGTGNAATKAYIAVLGDVNARAQAARAAARGGGGGDGAGGGITSRQERTRNISTARSFLYSGLGINQDSSVAEREFAVRLDRHLTNAIQGGEDPTDAALRLLQGAEPWISGQRRLRPTTPGDRGRAATPPPATARVVRQNGRLVIQGG
jgi:hypothetical protein